MKVSASVKPRCERCKVIKRSGVVMVTMVLLKVAWICACPTGTFFFSRFLARVAFFRSAMGLRYFLRRTPTVLREPRRCRALVLVRCPREGRLRRCRTPR